MEPISALGELVCYRTSSREEAIVRVAEAEVLIVNKVRVDKTLVDAAPRLRLICEAATGVNNIDLGYAASKGIPVRNAVGYSTDSVVQTTFMMILALVGKCRYFDDFVRSGEYSRSGLFTDVSRMFFELKGKRLGIIGLGNIGRRVAAIAEAFGADVIYSSPSGSAPQPGYHQVPLHTLLKSSDIISVHAPLNQYTENLINADALKEMKPACIFLNLGRGPIVVEQDLADALKEGQIAAAGLDVLCKEPMSADNPLYAIRDSRRLFITPHIGWASVEARTRLMGIIYQQIREFFAES